MRDGDDGDGKTQEGWHSRHGFGDGAGVLLVSGDNHGRDTSKPRARARAEAIAIDQKPVRRV
jgi:hypothetical protein